MHKYNSMGYSRSAFRHSLEALAELEVGLGDNMHERKSEKHNHGLFSTLAWEASLWGSFAIRAFGATLTLQQ